MGESVRDAQSMNPNEITQMNASAHHAALEDNDFSISFIIPQQKRKRCAFRGRCRAVLVAHLAQGAGQKSPLSIVCINHGRGIGF